jgi:hypothetical protein
VTEKKDAQTLSEKAPYSPYVGRTYATDVYWSYCQMLCMEESGGVPDFLNTIYKSNTSNNFG